MRRQSDINDTEIRQAVIHETNNGFDFSQAGANVYQINEVFCELKEGEVFEAIKYSNSSIELRVVYKGDNFIPRDNNPNPYTLYYDRNVKPTILGPCDILAAGNNGTILYKVSDY